VTDNSDPPWALRDPWTTTHPDHPLNDEASAAVLDDAAEQLTLLRSPLALGDALAELHAKTSLLAELRASLPATVLTARDQDHTWHDIARQLQITPATARRRYGQHQRRTQTTPTSPKPTTNPTTCSSHTSHSTPLSPPRSNC
jgi:hypothetical protein